MLNGWLVVNHFLKSQKFDEIYQWLHNSAEKHDISLERHTNAEVINMLAKSKDCLIKNSNLDFILFWDKDVRLARLLEGYGVRLFNSADSIEICDDKYRTYTMLKNHNIKMPETIVVPMSYLAIDWNSSDVFDGLCSSLRFPVILKECFGSFGEQVYLIESPECLALKMNEIGIRPMIIQEYIESSKGRDLRLNVVGDEVVACMHRFSTNGDFRANVTNGASMEMYNPTDKQVEMAVTACKLLGLDFGGVDILFDEDESPILCEVNSNAHFKNIYDCTKINVADFTLEYIAILVENGEFKGSRKAEALRRFEHGK